MGTIESQLKQYDYAGQLLGGVYRFESFLGHGGFGEVWKGTDTRNSNPVAIKLLPPGVEKAAKSLAQLEHECRMLIGLSHPNICRMLDFIHDKDLGVALVTEFVDGTDIFKASTPETIGPTIVQLLQALTYLHDKKVYHFDIKPGNVLVENGTVKLIDFGLSSLFPERRKAGTPSYMAPEIFKNENDKDARTELYAVGALWLICLTRDNPFKSISLEDAERLHLNWRPDAALLARPGGKFIAKLLSINPDERFQTASTLLNQLQFVFPNRVALTEKMADAYGGAGGTFIGRRDIVNTVLAWSKLREPGQAMWMAVGGERGIGKSRLMAHCKLKAQAEKCRTIEIHSADDITLEALKPLSDSLADQCLPLLIVLDDYDCWINTLAAEPLRHLLDTLQRHPHPPTRVFCLIGCADTREVPFHFTQTPLKPFTEAEVAEFVEAVAHAPESKRSELAHRLWQHTEGNPEFLTRIVTALTRQGLLVSEAGGWDESLFEDISIDIPEYSIDSKAAAEESPDDVLVQCRADRRTGHPLRALDRLLHYPQMTEPLLLEAVECAISTGKANEVIALIQQHLPRMPNRARLMYQSGILHMVKNDHNAARAVLQDALQVCRAGAKDSDDKASRDVIALSISIRNQLARCDMLQGKFKEAVAQFRETRRDEAKAGVGDAVRNNELGYALLLSGKNKEASKVLEEDIQKYKKLGHVRRLLQTMIWHGNATKSDIARHDYEQVAELARDFQELRVLGESYNALAGIMLQERKITEGMEYYRKALSLHYTLHQLPGAAVIMNNQGLCQLGLGNLSDARHRFETAMEYLKDAPQSWRANLVPSLLGMAEIYRQENHISEADAMLDQADDAARRCNAWDQHAYSILMTRAQLRHQTGELTAARDLATAAKPHVVSAPERQEWESFTKSLSAV